MTRYNPILFFTLKKISKKTLAQQIQLPLFPRPHHLPMVPDTKSPPPVGLVGGTCDAYKATRRVTPGSHRRVPGHLRCELRSGGLVESNHDQPYLGGGFKHFLFFIPFWRDFPLGRAFLRPKESPESAWLGLKKISRIEDETSKPTKNARKSSSLFY